MDFHAVLTANGYSQRKLAKATGISQSEISRMYNGTKPWHPTILELMEEWTNEDLTIKIPVCDDCGGAHYTRCHGKRGAVVILSDSERIVAAIDPVVPIEPKRHDKPAKVYWRPSLPLSLKQRAQDAGIDIRQLIENALEMTT